MRGERMCNVKIHHLGVIVKKLDKSIELYLKLGYTIISTTIRDPIQNNNIIFVRSNDGTQVIELIEPINKNSSVYGFQEGYHHVCYDISGQKDYLNKFSSMKIGKIFTKPIIAPAIDNRQVVFAILKNNTFVEFLI